MTRNKLLQSLGLFVLPGCLPGPVCDTLVASMRIAPSRPASVYDHDATSAVKPGTRKSLSVDVPAELDRLVRGQLDARRLDLARHFDVTLESYETPQYLLYEPGGFFRPHADARRDVDSHGRLVSVVIFLSTPGAHHDYEGGELRLFNLIEEPRWQGIGLGSDAERGLLIAFRSDTVHEVTPVTRGLRCAIATWFR